jgi:hypothetical protein
MGGWAIAKGGQLIPGSGVAELFFDVTVCFEGACVTHVQEICFDL